VNLLYGSSRPLTPARPPRGHRHRSQVRADTYFCTTYNVNVNIQSVRKIRTERSNKCFLSFGFRPTYTRRRKWRLSNNPEEYNISPKIEFFDFLVVRLEIIISLGFIAHLLSLNKRRKYFRKSFRRPCPINCFVPFRSVLFVLFGESVSADPFNTVSIRI